MGDYAKKPKNYKRGRCLEFERICREERAAGATVVVVHPCQRTEGLPCLIDIMVLAGLEQPCKHCAPNVQRMRDMHGWVRHPSTHGEFYTTLNLQVDQLNLILHRIGQADVRNWINTEEVLP